MIMSQLMLLLIAFAITFTIATLHIVSENNKQFDLSILNLSESDFYYNIWSRDFVKSQPVALPIQHHAKLQAVYQLWLSSFALLQDYIQEFNTNAFAIMQQAETQCLTIMYNIYSNNIYKNWVSINNVKKQSDEIKYSANYNNAKKNTFSSLLGTLSSLSISTMTGDIVTPFYMASNLGENLYDYLSSKSEKENDKVKEELQLLTEEETMLLNEKLFAFSKIYCINAFHLHLYFNKTTNIITLNGDKIDYIWLTNLINVLISNIDLRIISIVNGNIIDKDKDPITQSLISYKQKLNILKTIVHSLSDIVSYEFHTTLQKQILSKDIVYTIKYILDAKFNHLQHLNYLLIKDFPETEEKMQQLRQIMTENRRLKKLENDLKLFQQETDSLQHNFESNLEQDKIMHNLNLLKQITWSYVNIVSNTIDFGAFSLRNITRHCVNFVTSIPLGIVEGIGYNINDLIWTIVNNLWLSLITIFAVYCLVKKFINIFI